MDDSGGNDSGLGLASETPLTNRGSLTPQKPQFKGIDYLRLTVWDSPKNLMDRLESSIFDRYCPDDVGTFEERGPAGRLTNRFTCSVRGLTVEETDDWSGVTLKGEACTHLGNDALLQLMGDFPGVRVRASRIDLAWDGFPLAPSAVHRHLIAGNVLTRSKLDPSFITTATGDTCYTHDKPEKRGISRYCRWYNMRGPTRAELVLRHNYAADFVDLVTGCNLEDLHDHAMAAYRGLLDFVAPGAGRVDRRRLLAAWQRFIEDAQPWTPSQHQSQVELIGLELLGRYDGQLQRSSRLLCEAMEAYGSDYVIARIKYHGGDKVRPDEVAKLKSIRSAAANKYVAGVKPWPESYNEGEVPI